MNILFNLEQKFGHWAIPNLIKYILYGQAGFYLMNITNPGGSLDAYMTLEWSAFLAGEWWRIFTFMLIPPHMNVIFAIFYLMIMFMINDGMERSWGSFKINLFFLLSTLTHIAIAAVVGGGVHPIYINMALFVAFAGHFPDIEFLLFFILPVKVKWLAWLDLFLMTMALVRGDTVTRLMVLACFGVLGVFFGPWLRLTLHRKAAAAKNQADWEMKQLPERDKTNMACTECSRKDEEAYPRLCTCESCGAEGKFWCEEHLAPHLSRINRAHG